MKIKLEGVTLKVFNLKIKKKIIENPIERPSLKLKSVLNENLIYQNLLERGKYFIDLGFL